MDSMTKVAGKEHVSAWKGMCLTNIEVQDREKISLKEYK